jgi:DNA (cytosine-5)-methyltransferase 1
MNVGSLFSGVGGFDLGLERAGHEIRFQCEVNPFRREVLAKHWPGMPLYPDVRELTEDDLAEAGEIDLLCGGFPCQDLSIAGTREGLQGDRSGLFFQFARIADLAIRGGGWILIENVPGLLSNQQGRDHALLLATLGQLGFHDLAWRVVDSQFFGIPQRRRRIFILARRSGGQRSAEILLDFQGSGRDRQEGGEARDAAPSSSRIGPPENRISPPVTSKWVKGSGGPAGDECQNLVASPAIDSNGMREASGIPGWMDDRSVTAFHAKRDPISSDEVTPALGVTTHLGVKIDGRIEGSSCAIDPRPDGRRYEAMGDAVSVPVAEWIGRRLKEAEG